MSRRHRARRLALQALCGLDVQGERARDSIDAFVGDSRESPETVALAREMISGVLAEREIVDGLLVRHARHWQLGRLALVDRNILRLGGWELCEGRTPFRVVITEALNLAHEFSTAESPRFINGILDAVSRELREGADPTPGQ